MSISPRPNRRQITGAAAAIGVALYAGSAARATLAGGSTSAENLLKQTWDHVIVGGGSAGCVLARRLSEDAGRRVLLLEAGGDVHDPMIAAPPAWPTLQGGAYDWKYHSVPQVGLAGRILPQPRGKGLGGSTLINALGFQRGPRQAYDRWAELTGEQGWGFAGLLPYFKRLETHSGGADAWRGDAGPLHVLDIGKVADQSPYSQALAAAGQAKGYPLNPDWNGARADGTIWTQLTIRNGERDTAASAFLDPVRGRPNLGIVTGALVTRLRMRGARCEGVELLIDGQAALVSARETILSAGAFDSPRLLMLSGIGAGDAVRRLGIGVQADLPGVGRNLQDHPLVAGLLFKARKALPPAPYNHCETMVIAQSSGSPDWADLQIMGLDVPFLLPNIGVAPSDTFSLVPALMRPRSTGALWLASSDPLASAVIDPAYLREQADVDALVEAVGIARDLAHAAPMREWVEEEVFPGPQMTDKAAIAAHVRQSVSPFFHPVSTCRMGRADDGDAVVDPACRVRGVERLRVIDASVFPSIPQAMTNAAVLALAERAADLVRG
jgi:choline dehydrogenase